MTAVSWVEVYSGQDQPEVGGQQIVTRYGQAMYGQSVYGGSIPAVTWVESA